MTSLGEPAWDEAGALHRVVRARVEGELAIDLDVGDLGVRSGAFVTIERSSVLDVAEVTTLPRRVLLRAPPVAALRLATPADLRAIDARRSREARILREASELARSLGVPAKVVRVTARRSDHAVLVDVAGEERFDVRELVRGLSVIAQARVELRHLGLRDATKILGGVGPCGLQLCCNTFLEELPSPTIKMAKAQSLPIAEGRVNGVCGKLLCCLVYEEAQYRAARAKLPKLGDRVVTPRGEGTVRELDVLAEKVRVAIGGELSTFSLAEIARSS